MIVVKLNSSFKVDTTASSSERKLYLRPENIIDLPQDVTTNIEELEKIYLSTIIQEIYIMHIDDLDLMNIIDQDNYSLL
jgi:hypothetical protein